MSRMIFTLALVSAAAIQIAAYAQSPLTLKSVSIDLPDRSTMFSGPGSDVVNDNCLACHSAGMVLNQPALPTATWQAEAEKMIHIFKAPVDEKDVPAIVEYLTRTKGTK
ncbi:c-type cytochrome [Bradyrhizobium sp.]|jgi:cytochrome c5|uniref:c-type cytochrome n=1 Tax=Bradyrhizobium sp. TaxID=376 RepID=UPI003C1D4E0D